MKVIYLVTTCAYCLQFIANYLTVVTEVVMTKMGSDFVNMSPWFIWLIYVIWLYIISGLSYYFYQNQKCHQSLIGQANVLFYFAIASVCLLVFFLLMFVFDFWKNFAYEQVCYNGEIGKKLMQTSYNWQKHCCVGGELKPLA